MTSNLVVAAAVQSIIKSDTSQTKTILAAMLPELREQVVEHFRSNIKLQTLFPEYVDLVVDKN
jgi:hypothetical protein